MSKTVLPEGEKRRSPRIAIRQMIEMEYPKETFFNAEWVNASQGGMLCKTKYHIAPLTKVYFIIELSGEGEPQFIQTEGTVMHTSSENGYTLFGVAFAGLSDEEQEAFDRFLQSKAEESGY